MHEKMPPFVSLACSLLLLLLPPIKGVSGSCSVDEAIQCASGALQDVQDARAFLPKSSLCSALVNGLSCMDEALVSCSPTMLNTRVLLAQTMIYDEMNKTGCKKLSTTTPPTPSRPPVICHDLKHPALINNVSADPVATIPDQFVASADPSPSLDCPLPQPNPNLEHCSLFGFSHLRPFGKNTLSTCLMPGPWFLVKRPDVRVFVHNRVPRKSAVGNVAKIAQVTVEFPAHTCYGNRAKVYSTTIGSGMPLTFKDNTTGTANHSVMLNVTTSKDGSSGSAIMRSHIFNVTVSIRMYSGHFAVAIQSPEHLQKWRGRGLCYTGCPNSAEHVDVVAERDAWCTEVGTSTIRACGSRGTILNGHGGSGLTYLDACRFDVVKEQDYQMVAVTKMAAEDALLLGPKKPAVQRAPRDRLLFQQRVHYNTTTTEVAPPQIGQPIPDSTHEESLDTVSSATLCAVPVTTVLLALTVLVLQ